MNKAFLMSILVFFQISVAYAGMFDWVTGPSLSKGQKQWKMFNRNVDTEDPNYPVKVISDGYKMIKAYTREARKLEQGAEIPKKDLVQWGWKCTVKNMSQKILYIKVDYILQDKDGFEISKSSQASNAITPGEQITLRATGTFNYSDLDRVFTSTWHIPHSENPIFH